MNSISIKHGSKSGWPTHGLPPKAGHGATPWRQRSQTATRAAIPNSTAGSERSLTRLKMTLAYDGTGFAGFQFQTPKIRTVQGELEKAATRLFMGKSRMVASSRTDAGAHAHGAVVHFDVSGQRESLETDALMFNSFLPPDIRALSLEAAPPGFDAHFSALGKLYHYRLSCGPPDPLQAKQRWDVYDRWCERNRGSKPTSWRQLALDVAAMRQAAQLLLGTHDFSAFTDAKRPPGAGALARQGKRPKAAAAAADCTAGAQQGASETGGAAAKGAAARPPPLQQQERSAEQNTRTVWRLDVVEEADEGGGGWPGQITLAIAADGFLFRMVRVIASALVEVGHGRLSPAQLEQLLLQGGPTLPAAKRAALPEAAPPHGLCLKRVYYADDAAELPPQALLLAAERRAKQSHQQASGQQQQLLLAQGGDVMVSRRQGSGEGN